MMIPVDRKSERLRTAILNNNLDDVKEIIEWDTNLLNTDLRPEPDEFTNGYPLVIAAERNFTDIAKFLLSKGADPDSRSTLGVNPPEFGLGLYHAVLNENYTLANSFLDYGADPNSFPYCNQSTIEVCFYAARKEGISAQAIRHAYARWLPDSQEKPNVKVADLIGDNRHDVVAIFARLVDLGGIPQLGALVREGQDSLVYDILRHSAYKDGSPHDHPNATVLENIVGSARWHGYPEILIEIMEKYPIYFDYSVIIETIECAIHSHNRDGDFKDYRRIISRQLKELVDKGLMKKAIADAGFNPIYTMATGFIWHENYGYRASIADPECYINLGELFWSYELVDVNSRPPNCTDTPLTAAIRRGNHPGISVFIEWLLQKGANSEIKCRNGRKPIEIAEEMNNQEIVRILIDRNKSRLF